MVEEVTGTGLNLDYSFVCFVDLLGFSAMVKSDCEGPTGKETFIKKLLDIHLKTVELARTKEIHLTQFSDCVVFSTPYCRASFPEFLNIVSQYQYDLFGKTILCRGGVAHGKHFAEGTFMFSNGLLEAYELERSVAKYPRIVVSRNLINLLYNMNNVPVVLPVIEEDDGQVFLDFLRHGDYETCLGTLRGLESMASETNISVTEKLRWLTSYFDHKFAHDPKQSKPRFRNLADGIAHGS